MVDDIPDLPAEPVPTRGYLPTRCCVCGTAFKIRPSIAMLIGHNSGHASCPRCGVFLHIVALEGEASTERWDEWLSKQKSIGDQT